MAASNRKVFSLDLKIKKVKVTVLHSLLFKDFYVEVYIVTSPAKKTFNRLNSGNLSAPLIMSLLYYIL